MEQTNQEDPQDQGPPVYFMPGQLLLVVDHPPIDQPEDLIGRLKENPLVARNDTLANAVVDPNRVQTFAQHDRERRVPFPPRADHSQFSLVFFDASGTIRNPNQLTALIDDLNLRALDSDDRSGNRQQFVTVVAASPNWLATPAGEPTGGSGPGARPVPVDPLPNPLPYRFALEALPQLSGEQAHEQPVEVTILDTAPSCGALQRAYHRWAYDHPLLRGLFGQLAYGLTAPLSITYAQELDISLPNRAALHPRGHNYPMADHGLFVAGIIWSIAPHARLQLIQVLNDYGVGHLEGITAALRDLADDRARRRKQSIPIPPLIINMSLTIVTPLPKSRGWNGDVLREGHPKDGLEGWDSMQDRDGEDQCSRWEAARELLSKALESVCISLHHEEVLIVAAAGNDGKPGSHYGARNPAAYESVLGVGALVPDAGAPSGYAMAFYSNDSDDPLSAGIATLGGDADPMTYDTRPDSGVLGVYTGEFPQAGALPNPNGWAWWAGTSFAAPVITGALAAIIGNNRPPAQAQQELRDFVEAPGTMPNLEIFPVRQEP